MTIASFVDMRLSGSQPIVGFLILWICQMVISIIHAKIFGKELE